MAKDATAADPPASHIEKPVSSEEAVVSTQEDPKATGDRRSSVALNVIENPLTRVSAEQAVADARRFAEEHGMAEHADLFGRGVLVARDMDNFQNVPGLTPEELAALEYERDHKWHGPRMLWYAIGLCAMGAATQGWDQTGTNGANLTFPKSLGLDVENSATDQWIQGLINSIIFLTAGLIGAFIVDPLNHYFGRRGEIFLTAVCLTVTPIGSACAQSWQGLFAARFIMGIGIGAKNATVPIYSAEMAPARIRGALVMFWQLWVVIGIFLGLLANIAVLGVDDDLEWRLQLGSAFIPSLILAAGIYFCPESPRWLMKHGRQAEAFKAMCRLRAHDIIGVRDYYYSWVIYEEEARLAAGSTYFSRLWDCFAVPRIRRSNYGASTVMIAQQMCGINIISFYSSSIFENVGYSPQDALYASLGYGAVQVLATIPTLFLIDTKGRRTLCMIPGVLGLTFPRMQTVMTPTGAFGFYAGLNLIAWFMIFCFVRETKQLTLEEIDQVFSVPTSQFISHEFKVSVPYFFKRHVLRKNIPKPPPLMEKAGINAGPGSA
ncbi:hypothetical protein CHGG_02596 [Chaetomium globosum CBS 148.51]|uniref:Major facilitator superfamily (MFS) profile domain-containing protein n=1 Tax=Chaetomium globosum (strain ATCC 6205 / CBS 148.51 / DSM 1962 / NBRC 6347 / NRRL 1970) TaxID=306901 RepID=Q2HB08_CHAGB|nr:uncharacterized protein CHGG_02596 [Chaetomium globosum CBS 148.51]EAQ90661.1 hypothetical protein CHGG_02596 [Chaetomium globosum CBS 148.51]